MSVDVTSRKDLCVCSFKLSECGHVVCDFYILVTKVGGSDRDGSVYKGKCRITLYPIITLSIFDAQSNDVQH